MNLIKINLKKLNQKVNKYSIHLFGSFFELNFYNFYNFKSNFFIIFKNFNIFKIFKFSKYFNLVKINYKNLNYPYMFNVLKFDFNIIFSYFNNKKYFYFFKKIIWLFLKTFYKITFDNFSFFYNEVYLTGYFRSIRFWKKKFLVFFKTGKTFLVKIFIPTNSVAKVVRYRTIKFFSKSKSESNILCKKIISFRPASVFNKKGIYIKNKPFLLKKKFKKKK